MILSDDTAKFYEEIERYNTLKGRFQVSKIEMYAIQADGKFKRYAEINNSWLGAMHVWKTLSDKYNHKDSMINAFSNTWGKFNKNYYYFFEDIVLGSTFDYVIVKKLNFDELIMAFEMYVKYNPGSNLSEQIDVLNRMQADSSVHGVAWHQTTLSCFMWEPDYDDDKNEPIPYDMTKDTGHWNLFDKLKA